mmetsp:Transcript_60212/g.152857  ORF Transcript_60212/g.152857 Transcript_60212/m.152857 type:complete len:365 (-) Transcript_60212:10-1104(-)
MTVIDEPSLCVGLNGRARRRIERSPVCGCCPCFLLLPALASTDASEKAEDLNLPAGAEGCLGAADGVVPGWMEDTFLPIGYRARYSFAELSKSLFMWHNQTLNIHTHLWGSVLFLCYAASDLSAAGSGIADGGGGGSGFAGMGALGRYLLSPEPDAEMEAQLWIATIFTFHLSGVFMLGSSALFHLYCSHSARVYEGLLRLDLCGIAVMFGGSYLPAVAVGFRCFWLFRFLYLLFGIAILGVGIATGLRVIPQQYGVRTFIGMGFVSVLPATHWVIVAPREKIFTFCSLVFGMLGLYGIGAAFYMTRFPEAYFPRYRRTFSFVGGSHQFWHLFVLLAAVWWHSSMLYYRSLVLSGEVQCPAAMP